MDFRDVRCLAEGHTARKERKSDVILILGGSQAPSLPTISGWCSVFSRSLQYLEANEVRGRQQRELLLHSWLLATAALLCHLHGLTPLHQEACVAVNALPLDPR